MSNLVKIEIEKDENMNSFRQQRLRQQRQLQFCQYIFAISLISPVRKGRGPSFEQPCIPFTQGCFMQSSVEMGLVVLKKCFKFRQYIFAISLLSPVRKARPFI